MQDRPEGLDERDLIATCAEGWTIDLATAEYLPVGAGSYHWSLTDRRGAVWFAKVDDVDLARSYETALVLHRDAGLDFVLAPVPATDGTVQRRIDSRYAVTMFPMIAGTTGGFGPHRPEDLRGMVDLLAALHLATPAVAGRAPHADLVLPGRDGLHEALRDLDRPWSSGPHAEPARHLLAENAGKVGRWLADFDRLTGEVSRENWVVTHGEPHPGNVLRTPAGLRLIDWGTVQIAPPERDLWMLTSAFTDLLGEEPVGVDKDVFAGYTDATGHPVSPAGIALYRRWWELADVAAYVDDLRGPHGDGEDPAAALTYLSGYLRR
jgi:Ser/Thr protein kinase RdoA (MazF antagonist)